MENERDDLDVQKKVGEHETKLTDLVPRMENVEKEQLQLKQGQQEINRQMEGINKEMMTVKHGQTQMENTLMREGQHTRETLNKVIEYALGTAQEEQQKENEIEKMEKKNSHEYAIKKLDTKEKIIVAIGGGGGLLAIINFFTTLGGK